MYYLQYVIDSSPALQGFKTKEELEKFRKKIKVDPMAGTWVDYSFETNSLVLFDLDTNLILPKAKKKARAK